MYLEDVMTVPASVAGIPGISIPCGFMNKMPLGLQILGPHKEEAKILSVAHQLFSCHSE
jgi:aspartyl-tRNA(Asn)/glutamyl-tRNA(Gln) amidotransferase subunit A